MTRPALSIDQILADYHAGLSPMEIGEKYSRHPSNIYRRLKEVGIVHVGHNAKKAMECLSAGMNGVEAAKECGVNVSTVMRHRDRLIGGPQNRVVAGLLLALPDENREWILRNTPKGCTALDLIAAIIADAVEDDQ
jgi:hypothetical protein